MSFTGLSLWLRRLHAVTPHQVELALAIGRICSGPQKLQLFKVLVQRWGVKDEQSSRRFAGISKRVDLAGRCQDKRCVGAVHDFVADSELHLSVQDKVSLVVGLVAMSWRHSTSGRQRPLHERQSTMGVRAHGLKPHLTAPRLTVKSVTALEMDYGPPPSFIDCGPSGPLFERVSTGADERAESTSFT
jgi:hypothetical protein